MSAPPIRHRAAVTLLLLSPLAIVAELAVAAAVWASGSAPYDLVANTMSDLGATTCTIVDYPHGAVPVCSPWHGFMNASFAVLGLALAAGMVLLRPALPRRRLVDAAIACWVVAGLSSVGTALVPLDVDLELHVLVSAPAFLAQPVALALTGWAVRARHPRLGRWGVALGVVCLVAGALVFGLVWSEAGGLLERVALWPGFVWPAALALAYRAPRAVTHD